MIGSNVGGAATVESYRGADGKLSPDPDEHVDFIRTWGDYFETQSHFFVHGSYEPERPLAEQHWQTMRWQSLKYGIPGRTCFRQDGHRRAHVARRRRDSQPGPPHLHRHLLLGRRLAHGPRYDDWPDLAGRSRRPAAARHAGIPTGKAVVNRPFRCPGRPPWYDGVGDRRLSRPAPIAICRSRSSRAIAIAPGTACRHFTRNRIAGRRVGVQAMLKRTLIDGDGLLRH